MVEHVEKQMLQMPMLVVRAEKQMLKVGTWRQMLVKAGKQMGKLDVTKKIFIKINTHLVDRNHNKN